MLHLPDEAGTEGQRCCGRIVFLGFSLPTQLHLLPVHGRKGTELCTRLSWVTLYLFPQETPFSIRSLPSFLHTSCLGLLHRCIPGPVAPNSPHPAFPSHSLPLSLCPLLAASEVLPCPAAHWTPQAVAAAAARVEGDRKGKKGCLPSLIPAPSKV